jgi:hypothetical protein
MQKYIEISAEQEWLPFYSTALCALAKPAEPIKKNIQDVQLVLMEITAVQVLAIESCC